MRSMASEWPLVVFTTVSPLCAGVWIVAGLLALVDAFPGAADLTVGYAGAFLCVLLVAALACSTLHLGKPLKALRAFMRLGNSSVSNEVFVGSLFAAGSCLYVLVAQGLIEQGDMWKIPLAFVSGFAGLFVLFQCLAYRMRTVRTWASPSFSVEFAVIALLSGIAVEGVVLSFAPTASFDVRAALVASEAICCVVAVCVVHAQGSVVAKEVATRRDRRQLLAQWNVLGITRIVLLAVGVALWGYGMLAGLDGPTGTVAGMTMVLLSIVVGRCSFYRFYLNVGLPQG